MEAFFAAMLNPKQVDSFLRTLVTPQCSLLRAGIEARDPRVIGLFINHSFPSDARFDEGETKLHLAVRMNNEDLVKQCLEEISADIRADRNITPLMLAAALGYSRIVTLLLEHGANPDIRNAAQQTALHCALCEKQESIVLQLIPAMKNLNSQDRDGDTALIQSATRGLKKAMSLLLKMGVTLDMRNEKGLNALHHAALFGHEPCAALLIQYHVDINSKTAVSDEKLDIQNTALHFAAQRGHLAVCKLLLLNGADPLIENAGKTTPMDLVFFGKDVGLVELFSQMPQFFNPQSEWNRLRVCIANDNAEGLQQLIAFNIDVTQVNEKGDNALHFAAAHDATLCAGILIRMGCCIDAIDHEGNTPLHIAAKTGSVGVVNLLIQADAEINVVNQAGLTPLLIAIENNHLGVILKLIVSGANLNQTSKHGTSPAVLALSKNLNSVATMLTIFTQRMLTQDDFMGEYEKLFYMPVVLQWMQLVLTAWNASVKANDTLVHLAVRLDSPETIHLLAIGLPNLLSVENGDKQTPKQLAETLGNMNSCNALALHNKLLQRDSSNVLAHGLWRVKPMNVSATVSVSDYAARK